MFTKKQKEEILEHLDRAKNPVFFYDNDADGLCSFLIIRRYLGRGKGVSIRSYPGLDASYAKKAEELNADYVFVLDKPVLSEDFVNHISLLGIPLVWIDHHDVENNLAKRENFFIYNPSKNKGKNKSTEPVTYLVYDLTKRSEDMWIALIGCIADHYMPKFFSDFSRIYPNFWAKNIAKPFDVYYKTEIGRVAQALGFGLKDSISNVVELQNFLIGSAGPEDVLLEMGEDRAFGKRYRIINSKYIQLLDKARENISDKCIFFYYGGDMSISADISNRLCYDFPDKYIAVAYIKGGITNISLRGKGVKKVLARIIDKLEGASGGGHEDAVGARIKSEDLEKFKEFLLGEI